MCESGLELEHSALCSPFLETFKQKWCYCKCLYCGEGSTWWPPGSLQTVLVGDCQVGCTDIAKQNCFLRAGYGPGLPRGLLVQLQPLRGKSAQEAPLQTLLERYLWPPLMRDESARAEVTLLTIAFRALSTSSRMKVFDSPALCKRTFTVLSSSWSMFFFR